MAWAAWGVPALLLLFAVFLIAPNPRGKARCRGLKGLYAHRGLHDGNHTVPENSMAAFRLAVEAGYGIELDVRLTRDGQLAVYHDASLKRLCSRDVLVRDLTLAEISACTLAGTAEPIPTFADVLPLVDGRVPLIVEIKSDRLGDRRTCEKAWALLKDYSGPWCVESFDPLAVRWFRKHAPGAVRGQLTDDPRRSREKEKPAKGEWLLSYLLINCLSRPDFIAYNHKAEGNPVYRLVKRLFRPGLVAWTVRSRAEAKALGATHDMLIFEAFRPEK